METFREGPCGVLKNLFSVRKTTAVTLFIRESFVSARKGRK